MQDVLGVSFIARPVAKVPAAPAVLILTPKLEPAESSLLAKILASVKLQAYAHHEVDVFDGLHARHVVLFDGGSGAREEEGGKYWHLPRLGDMLGASVEVTGLKRTTWTLLQQLGQELR